MKLRQALHDFEIRFKAMADVVPVGIFLADRKGKCIYVNEALLELSGRRIEECLGNAWRQTIHPLDLPEVEALLQADLNVGYDFLSEHRLVTGTGNIRWVRTRARPVLTSQPEAHGFICVVEDITEQRRILDKLREREALYHTTFHEAPVGITQCSLDGHYLMVNPQFCRITGYSAEELCHSGFQDITHPEDVEREETLIRILLADPAKSAETIEKRLIHRNGETVWIDLSVTVLRNAAGEPQSLIRVAQDISARKQLELMLLQAQKLEAVGLLAGGIAHDFNNLLTAITGYAELMVRRLPPGDPLCDLIAQIKSASNRGASLIAQLLAFGRRQVLQPKVLNLNTEISRNLFMLQHVIREDIEIITRFEEEPGQVRADPTQIDQILMNLAVNARDAMPDGGQLFIETAHVMLDSEYAGRHPGVRPGKYVMMIVSDTGYGMDADTQARIFEPFFTTKESGRGTGLGLATVYGIVKQSGGNIWVYSEPGYGTTFKIYLPRISAPVDEPEQPAEMPRELSGTETILVAEDDEIIRRLLLTILSEYGYKVIEAADPAEALVVCQEYSGPIDLLLTDVVMPGSNGRELYERVAQLRPEMRVIYMSGYTDDAIVNRGILEQSVNFISKPFLPETLAARIREVIGQEPA